VAEREGHHITDLPGTLADFAAAGTPEPVVLYRSLRTNPASTGSAYSADRLAVKLNVTFGDQRCFQLTRTLPPIWTDLERGSPTRSSTHNGLICACPTWLAVIVITW